MRFSLGLFLLTAALCARPVLALEEPDPVPTGLFHQKEYQEVYAEYLRLKTSRLQVEGRIREHNRLCVSVDPDDVGLINRCQASASRLKGVKKKHKEELAAYKDIIQKAHGKKQQVTREIEKLVSGIYKIKVPPPIPPEEASITFGQLPEGDKNSARILLGIDMGLAVVDMAGKIGGKVMPPLKLIIATGKVLIAAEDGADVYITKKNEVYERVLKYLKKPDTAREFTALVRALKAGQAIPEDADIEMVRAAKAILDPTLGSTGTRMAWNAMLSPEARSAALTQVTLEAYGTILGSATEKTTQRILALRNPAYKEAAYHLNKFTKTLPRLRKFPKTKDSVLKAIDQANDMIVKTYSTSSVTAKGVSTLNGLYQGQRFKKALEEWTKKRKQIGGVE